MSDSSDEEEGRGPRRDQQHRGSAAAADKPRKVRTLNAALAKALAEGFPGDTEMDRFVTQEELKREEDAAKSDMEKAEAKAKETLEEIGGAAAKGFSPSSSVKEGSEVDAKLSGGTGNVDKDGDLDSDDDLESAFMMGEKLDSLLGSVADRARYIPLRLSYEERKSLRLVNASVNVSNYTNTVDSDSTLTKGKRKHKQLQNICAFLTGLVCSCDYAKGQEVLEERNFDAHEHEIQTVLEISRRYKVTNPEKMRSEYGKLIMLMQDAVSTDLKPLLGIDVNTEMRTVYKFLESRGGLAVLENSNIQAATREILSEKGKSRQDIQLEIKRKERAIDKIAADHRSRTLSSDEIKHCLYSIGDNNSFLNSNRLPIDQCLAFLQKYFDPEIISDTSPYSLAIAEGSNGARLSHSHEFQFNYVQQSLTLWRNIVDNMFRLWYLAEQDLLDAAQVYELRDTGQGLQRIQQSPRVYRAMHEILYRTQHSLKAWVGSSVIHLGDRNVPNALVFIDKYTQVSRILGPLMNTLENLERATVESEGLQRYMAAYGGIEKAKKDILHDFFRFAFDGSGGNNDFDAGSCIDGRLTSAWNWCSQLSTKPFYPLFRLTGFLSFDGEFDR